MSMARGYGVKVGRDKVESRPSDLGFGSVVLGLGTVMEDGQEGTAQEAGRQAKVAAFCC